MSPGLEYQLRRWREWGLEQPPTLVRQLAGGRTNASYLLRCGAELLVLRINSSAGDELGIDREQERIILGLVGNGIAPAVIHNDPGAGILLSANVAGCHWQREALDATRLERLIELLQRVHQYRPRLARFDYAAHAEKYWQHLLRSGEIDDALHYQRERMVPLLAAFQNDCRCNALCHHDPVASNVIDAGHRLFLIDWEYAGRGCRAFDYAALGVEWCLDAAQLSKAVGPLACSLQLAEEVYAYLGLLWQAVRAGAND